MTLTAFVIVIVCFIMCVAIITINIIIKCFSTQTEETRKGKRWRVSQSHYHTRWPRLEERVSGLETHMNRRAIWTSVSKTILFSLSLSACDCSLIFAYIIDEVYIIKAPSLEIFWHGIKCICMTMHLLKIRWCKERNHFFPVPIRSDIPVSEFPDYVMEMTEEDNSNSNGLIREFSVSFIYIFNRYF